MCKDWNICIVIAEGSEFLVVAQDQLRPKEKQFNQDGLKHIIIID